MTTDTLPEVFIIESLMADDVENERREGDLIARILRMGGRDPKYCYVETRNQFIDAIQDFSGSEYRYLHISSHGAHDHFLFQFGEMYFNEFHGFVNGRLRNKRLFIYLVSSEGLILKH